MFLHAKRRAKVWFGCVRSYHIIALDAGALTVRLSELEDARLRAELLLAVLRWQDVLEGGFSLATPDAGRGAARGRRSVASRCSRGRPRRRAADGQFAWSATGTATTTAAAGGTASALLLAAGHVHAATTGNVIVAVATR